MRPSSRSHPSSTNMTFNSTWKKSMGFAFVLSVRSIILARQRKWATTKSSGCALGKRPSSPWITNLSIHHLMDMIMAHHDMPSSSHYACINTLEQVHLDVVHKQTNPHDG